MGGKNGHNLLIIIPAYNEEKNIGAVLDQLKECHVNDYADILVVDDASRDRTAQIAADAGCLCLRHFPNLGYGASLQRGYRYAAEHGYPYVIQMDADGQHDACNIRPIYKKLQKKDPDGMFPDIVIGSRFLPESRSFPIGRCKKLGFRFFRALIRMAARQDITDPTSGLQGLSRRAVRFYASDPEFDRKCPDADVLIRMISLGFRVTEVPAVMHERKNGTSMHSGLEPVLYMIRMTWKIFAVVWKNRKKGREAECRESESN